MRHGYLLINWVLEAKVLVKDCATLSVALTSLGTQVYGLYLTPYTYPISHSDNPCLEESENSLVLPLLTGKPRKIKSEKQCPDVKRKEANLHM